MGKEEEEKITNEVTLLSEKLTDFGISHILFDLDDTLIATRVIFRQQSSLYCKFVSEKADINGEELKQIFKEKNDELYEAVGVNPNRYVLLNDQLKSHFYKHDGKFFDEGLGYLQDIYRIIPQVFDGAIKTIDSFHKTGKKTALVTHANQDSTDFKINSLDLRKYFSAGVHVIDENGHKTAKEWQKVIEKLMVSPKKVMVVGDNLPGDIIATYNLGVKHLYYIDVGEAAWSKYRKGEIPEGVKIISGVQELIPTILS